VLLLITRLKGPSKPNHEAIEFITADMQQHLPPTYGILPDETRIPCSTLLPPAALLQLQQKSRANLECMIWDSHRIVNRIADTFNSEEALKKISLQTIYLERN
jgi:hypothetical protein